MTKRGAAVLDAPEQRYVSGTGGPRRAAAGLRRDLQQDYGQDFEDDFEREFGAGVGESERRDEGAPVKRRSAARSGVRRYGFLGWLPQTRWGRIGAGVGVVAVLGVFVGG